MFLPPGHRDKSQIKSHWIISIKISNRSTVSFFSASFYPVGLLWIIAPYVKEMSAIVGEINEESKSSKKWNFSYKYFISPTPDPNAKEVRVENRVLYHCVTTYKFLTSG